MLHPINTQSLDLDVPTLPPSQWVRTLEIRKKITPVLTKNAYQLDQGILRGTLETSVDAKNGEGHTTEEVDADTGADLRHIFRQNT